MKFLFISLKGLIILGGLAAMYFSSHFWTGSLEDWKEAVETRFWEFFFSRLLVTFLIGGIFLLISLLLNKIYNIKSEYSNLQLNRITIIELLCTGFASITFVLIATMN